MRTRVITILICAVAACGGKTSGGTTTPAATGDAMDAARRAVEQWRQAYEIDSFDAIAPLYIHDKQVALVQQGVPYIGWDAVSGHLREMLGHAREIHVRLKDVQITATEDAASVVATMDREVSDGTVSVSESGTLTLVLHRDAGGNWLVVAEHYSYPPHASS